MKRIFYTLALIAVAATACQKEDFKPEDLGKRTTVDTVEVDTTYYLLRYEGGGYRMSYGRVPEVIKYTADEAKQLLFIEESKELMDSIEETGVKKELPGDYYDLHTNLLRVDLYDNGTADTVDCGWYISERFCARMIEHYWEVQTLKDRLGSEYFGEHNKCELAAYHIVMNLLSEYNYTLIAYNRCNAISDLSAESDDVVYLEKGSDWMDLPEDWTGYDYGIYIKIIE